MLQPRPSHASPFAFLALVQLAGNEVLRTRLQRCLQRLKALRKVR